MVPVLCALFFSGLTLFAAQQLAGSNQDSLRDLLAIALCAALAVLGFTLSVSSFVSKRCVTLSATAVSVPSHWLSSRPATVMRLVDIRSMNMLQPSRAGFLRRPTFLELRSSTGKVVIAESYLPSRPAFDELCHEITRRKNLLSG